MKRFHAILCLLTVGTLFAACEKDAKFSEYIPVHPLSQMVLSASATCGEETVAGSVDNENHAIKFIFVQSSDFSEVNVQLNYASRTILGEGAPSGDKTVVNLSSPYTFKLNNQVEDFTYSISTTQAATVAIDKAQCKVLKLASDAVYKEEGVADYKSDPYYLFDGKHLSKKGAYSEIKYNKFSWEMSNPLSAAQEGHGNWFTFDVGASVRLSKMLLWPYSPYEGSAPAVYEIYAWPYEGEPMDDWANWVKIGQADDSAKWETTKNAEPGSADDLTLYGTTLEFAYGDVPEARYYRFKMVKNFYEAFGTAMNQYWSGRINWFDMAEMDLWYYNLPEEEQSDSE